METAVDSKLRQRFPITSESSHHPTMLCPKTRGFWVAHNNGGVSLALAWG